MIRQYSLHPNDWSVFVRANQVVLAVDLLQRLLVHKLTEARGTEGIVLVDDGFALFKAVAASVDGVLEGGLARVGVAGNDPVASQIERGTRDDGVDEREDDNKKARFLHF